MPTTDTPVALVVGMPADEVAARYRSQGFRVQITTPGPDGSAPVTADRQSDRIRLLVSDRGLVTEARRG